jgi:hypothetical protein
MVTTEYPSDEDTTERELALVTMNTQPDQQSLGRTDSNTNATREMVVSRRPFVETRNQSRGLIGSNTNETRVIELSGRRLEDEATDALAVVLGGDRAAANMLAGEIGRAVAAATAANTNTR